MQSIAAINNKHSLLAETRYSSTHGSPPIRCESLQVYSFSLIFLVLLFICLRPAMDVNRNQFFWMNLFTLNWLRSSLSLALGALICSFPLCMYVSVIATKQAQRHDCPECHSRLHYRHNLYIGTELPSIRTAHISLICFRYSFVSDLINAWSIQGDDLWSYRIRITNVRHFEYVDLPALNVDC